MDYLIRTIAIGVIATAVTDLWGLARRRLLGFPRPDYRLVGRWFAYMPRGQFRHDAIAASTPVHGEHVIGWAMHYLIGITFAAVLTGIWGPEWMRHPTIGPALTVGIGTVAAPMLLMQPGMGAGIAASRSPRPGAARIQSFLTHLVFGLGLYAAGWATLLLASPAR
ncbi:MAG: hypothetical protein AMXMBFR55_28440 [Gemmatimonadota bacterium]